MPLGPADRGAARHDRGQHQRGSWPAFSPRRRGPVRTLPGWTSPRWRRLTEPRSGSHVTPALPSGTGDHRLIVPSMVSRRAGRMFSYLACGTRGTTSAQCLLYRDATLAQQFPGFTWDFVRSAGIPHGACRQRWRCRSASGGLRSRRHRSRPDGCIVTSRHGLSRPRPVLDGAGDAGTPSGRRPGPRPRSKCFYRTGGCHVHLDVD